MDLGVNKHFRDGRDKIGALQQVLQARMTEHPEHHLPPPAPLFDDLIDTRVLPPRC